MSLRQLMLKKVLNSFKKAFTDSKLLNFYILLIFHNKTYRCFTSTQFLFVRLLKVLSVSALTLRSSTFLAAVTMPSRHFETMGMTLRSTSAKLRYVSPSLTVRRSSMSCRFYKHTNTEVTELHKQNYNETFWWSQTKYSLLQCFIC